ncbi:hypothetical protein [Microbacterium sp. p3-SID336]|uniref:hypothetical protein n=1 Tax=Microbacterium sp. p3-SID336 TaxID=2916212 RepID=UPI0021A8C741|nr:hypothetical protein [Microbacterium sp. p3-SID336]MCT1479105.1 hypothetical protein [Microbacterium sp. p3-SID336]
MSTSRDDTGPSSSAAAEALRSADAAAGRIRSRRRWYVAGALVMAATLATFTIALAAWPDRLAAVIVPGLLSVAAILALLGWSGRTIPTAATAITNRVMLVSAALMVVTLVLNRLLPAGFSGWLILTGLLPALPFLYLAWRVARA